MKGGPAKKQRLGQEVGAAAAAASSSSSHDHWKQSSKQQKRDLDTIDVSDTDDDQQTGKTTSKSAKFWAKMGKNEAAVSKPEDGEGGIVVCVVQAHGPDCEGLMPSCVKRVVKDLDAWRAHVIKKMQQRDLALAVPTAPMPDDTQEDTQGNFEDDTQALDF